jgi:hypothetical protein
VYVPEVAPPACHNKNTQTLAAHLLIIFGLFALLV